MSSEIAKCKITVLKRTVNEDLIEEYMEEKYQDRGPCEFFQEDQEFVIDPWVVPEEFCACCSWAWADIRHDILTVATGANMPGIKSPGTLITGCRDWFRPVIFKVERISTE
jgi:uncharacterized repeat protein (TIGR04076 family)